MLFLLLLLTNSIPSMSDFNNISTIYTLLPLFWPDTWTGWLAGSTADNDFSDYTWSRPLNLTNGETQYYQLFSIKLKRFLALLRSHLFFHHLESSQTEQNQIATQRFEIWAAQTYHHLNPSHLGQSHHHHHRMEHFVKIYIMFSYRDSTCHQQ